MGGSKNKKVSKHATSDDEPIVHATVGKLDPKTEVWLPGAKEDVFEAGSVVVDKKGSVTVRRSADNNIIKVPRDDLLLVDIKVGTGEKGGAKGMTDLASLKPPNLANILHTLKVRSTVHEMPYTFVGPVLVSVNPLRAVKDEDKKKKGPHPHRIAEAALKQMKFAKITNQPLDQSIIVSGESGAGKTEASKRVLSALVSARDDKGGKKKKEDKGGGKTLDKQLIDTNPILEAFGNATTLRNRNSSRFGKFIKLHVDIKNDGIKSAMVETYLLERSRVSGFVLGECNYHIFYILMGGADRSTLSDLGLSGGAKEFEYMVPLGHDGYRDAEVKQPHKRPDKRDKEEFPVLCDALKTIGVSSSQQKELFGVVAAILHMGNIEIEGAKADPCELSLKDKSLIHASKFLGVKPAELSKALTERAVTVVGEKVYAKLSVAEAQKARDAVAKQTYSHLFSWIVNTINGTLNAKDGKKPDAFIGILDIFGFETFTFNDLEQLLINLCNEQLHGIFLQKVFDAELTMYMTEGLLPKGGDKAITVPDNVECLKLLMGVQSPTKQLGVLDVIVDEGHTPGANDTKMNKELHKRFANNKEYFPRVHPKDIDHQFKIKHFPGVVTYHIGNMLDKNHDRLPSEIEDLFLKSSSSKLVTKLWESGIAAGLAVGGAKASKSPKGGAGRAKAQPKSSIVTKFKQQMQALGDTLNASQCSFIRCVKPNFYLERKGESKDWFQPDYISAQLRSLGIEPTVQVLSKGMPNRITYAELVDTYKTKLPKEVVKTWKKMGGGDKNFIGALFSAFDISADKYKLGFSRVFFKSGDLESLERVLEAGATADEKELKKLGKRFKTFLIRAKWRKCIAIALSCARFKMLLQKVRGRALKKEKKKLKGVVMAQSMYRGWKAREKYVKLRKKRVKDASDARTKKQEELWDKTKSQNVAFAKADLARKKAEEEQADEGKLVMREAMRMMREAAAEERDLEGERAQLTGVRKELKELSANVKRLDKRVKTSQKELDKSANVRNVENDRMDKEMQDEDEGRFLMEQAMRMMSGEGSDDDDDNLEELSTKDFEKARKKHEHEQLSKQADREKTRMVELKEEEKKLSQKVKAGKQVTKKMKGDAEKALVDAGRSIKTKEGREAYEDAIQATEEAEQSSKKLAKEKREARKLDEELRRLTEEEHSEETKLKIANLKRRQQAEKLLNNQKLFARFRGNREVQAIKEKDENRKIMEAVVERKLVMQTVTFTALKRARRSGRNWKPRFFTLNSKTQELTYVKPGSRRVKGSFQTTPHTLVNAVEGVMEKKKHVLKIEDPTAGLLILSFKSDIEQFRIQTTFQDAIDFRRDEEASNSGSISADGGGHGSSYMDMKKFMGMEEEKHGRVSRTDTMTDDAAFTELVAQFKRGSITEAEFAQIVDNNEEELEENDMQPENEDDIDMEFNIQVTCEECATLNNTCRGPKCRLCRADLVVAPIHFL